MARDPAAEAGDGPLTAEDFAAALDRLGPFEPSPRLAVAVSGGPDSLALCLLAAEWAGTRGGSILALTVDHGIRPESGEEAAQVAAWLSARRIAHEVLCWAGPKPTAGIQEAARRARYRLIEDRCARDGILHLLLAHHRDDQAETVLMRLAKGSGPDGLAGMPAIREKGAVRLLRPLLGVPRARLAATLAARGQGWIEDPSNRSEAFARVRLRRSAAALAAEGLSVERLADTARRCGHARAALEQAAFGLMGEAVEVFPEGYLLLDLGPLRRAGRELALRVLARCLSVTGGLGRPTRLERLERLHAAVVDAGAQPGNGTAPRTLGGCLVRPWRGRLLIVREPGAIRDRFALVPNELACWDGRFLVKVKGMVPNGLHVARLGATSRLALEGGGRNDAAGSVPSAAIAALPAIWAGERLVAVPGLGYVDRGCRQEGVFDNRSVSTVFQPIESLGSATFAVV